MKSKPFTALSLASALLLAGVISGDRRSGTVLASALGGQEELLLLVRWALWTFFSSASIFATQ